MYNAILVQLGLDDDPDDKDLYNHINLRRQTIKHLIMNWSLMGKEISKNVVMQYGRPDSEIHGKLIAKEVTVKREESKKIQIQCDAVDGEYP